MTWLSTAIAKGALIALHLDETSGTTAADSSGNSYDFTYQGSETKGQSPIVVDGGYSIKRNIDDQNSLALLSSVPGGLAGSDGSYVCMEAWVRISTGNHHGYFIKTGGAANGLGVGIGDTTADSNGRVLNLGASGVYWLPTSYTFADGEHHVVVVMAVHASGGNVIDYYVDGAYEGSFTQAVNAAASYLMVGGTIWPDALAYLSSGVDLDACAYYDIQLTSTDVSDLYNAGIGAGSDYAGSATLTGSGDLITAGVPDITEAVATLGGTGTLGAIGVKDGDYLGTADLTGTGTITTTGQPAISKAVALTSTGVLGATGIGVFVDPIVIVGDPFVQPVIAASGLAGQAAVIIGGGTGLPDPTNPDPTTYTVSTGTGRWSFTDPLTSDYWEFPINPNAMDPPHRALNLTPGARNATVPTQEMKNTGVARVLQGKRQPLEWTFAGNIRTRDQYMQLRHWTHKRRRILVTDHFGRTWSILLQNLTYTEQRPTPRAGWKFTYVAHCIMYGRIS